MKIDSAKKIGQSPKLRSPWRGPYLIVEVKSPVLYKIQDRKGTSVIHHDRLKLYGGLDIPIWLKRLRNSLIKQGIGGNESENTNIVDDEEPDLGLDWLFVSNTGKTDEQTYDAVSDTLTADDMSDTLTAEIMSDILTSGNDVSVAPGTPNEIQTHLTVHDLNFLTDIPDDLDATLLYDLDVSGNRDHAPDDRIRRKRQIPRHLQNYVL